MAKTLLQLAGASKKVIDLKNSNILIIDMQNQYFSGVLNLDKRGEEALNNTVKFIDFARKNGVNIFHVAHVGGEKSSLFNPHSNEVKIINDLIPLEDEAVIEKSIPNSFYKTNLFDLLQLTGKKQLIIMGFASHMCVTASTIAAFELGFDNFVLTDCCATRDLPFFNETINSELIHKSSMALLGDRYATLISSTDIFN